MDLLELVERVEKAGGADRELDGRIWCALNGNHFVRWVRFDERVPWGEIEGTSRANTCSAGMVFENTSGGKGGRFQQFTSSPAYTASIDAVMTLIPADHEWLVRHDDAGAFANVSRCGASNETEPFDPDFPPTEEEFDRRGFAQGHRYARAATPALALCAAALKARAASVDTRRMAETGTGSGRSPSGAVPATPGDAPNDR